MAGFIYIVRAGEDGPVKIGYSADPDRRISKIQTDCPHRLSVLATGDADRYPEKQLHARFASARTVGEWFNPIPEILALARDIGFVQRPRIDVTPHPLREWREKRGLSREELSALVESEGGHMDRRYCEAIENGQRNPGYGLARVLFKISGVSVEILKSQPLKGSRSAESNRPPRRTGRIV